MSNSNPSGMDEDPLLALVDEDTLILPATSASKTKGPGVASRKGLLGAVLTVLVIALFFALVPLGGPDATPNDMTGVYDVLTPVAPVDVLEIERVDYDPADDR